MDSDEKPKPEDIPLQTLQNGKQATKASATQFATVTNDEDADLQEEEKIPNREETAPWYHRCVCMHLAWVCYSVQHLVRQWTDIVLP